MSSKNYRNMLVESCCLAGFTHDEIPARLHGKLKITPGSCNGLITRNGWIAMRSSDDRPKRLAEISEVTPFLAKHVEGEVKAGILIGLAKIADGRAPQSEHAEILRRKTLLRDIAAYKAIPKAQRAIEPEAMREIGERRIRERDPDTGEIKDAIVYENLSDCTLSWFASRYLIPEQLASAGIKYRADFHRIGGGLGSSGNLKEKVGGSAPKGHSGGALDAMQQRRKVHAALAFLYPKEAKHLERLLHYVAVEDRKFAEIRDIGEGIAPNSKMLIRALEPVGWAYGDWLDGATASALNSWWKTAGDAAYVA